MVFLCVFYFVFMLLLLLYFLNQGSCMVLTALAGEGWGGVGGAGRGLTEASGVADRIPAKESG